MAQIAFKGGLRDPQTTQSLSSIEMRGLGFTVSLCTLQMLRSTAHGLGFGLIWVGGFLLRVQGWGSVRIVGLLRVQAVRFGVEVSGLSPKP